jgi:RNA recognition motif-containing protein
MADQDKKGTKKISTNNLFVGNIPSLAQDKQLLDLFSQFGPICGIRFFKNASTKPNTKNSIIEYDNSSAVEQAFKNKAYLNIDGQALKISPLKQKRTQNENGCHQADQGEQFYEEEGCFAWESNNNAF